jgi:hypothetical protein
MPGRQAFHAVSPLAPTVGIGESRGAKGVGRRTDSPKLRCLIRMPSLVRFLVAVAFITALGAAAVVVLATFVDPHPREMTIRVPQDRFEAR